MANPVVALIQGWVQTYKACGDAALDLASDALRKGLPTPDAADMNFRQAFQYHSTVLLQCSAMLTAAIQIVATDATTTLANIDAGTKELAAAVARIQDVERAMTVLADLVTTVVDVVAAVSTLNLGSVGTAGKDLQTLVKDTIGQK